MGAPLGLIGLHTSVDLLPRCSAHVAAFWSVDRVSNSARNGRPQRNDRLQYGYLLIDWTLRVRSCCKAFASVIWASLGIAFLGCPDKLAPMVRKIYLRFRCAVALLLTVRPVDRVATNYEDAPLRSEKTTTRLERTEHVREVSEE
jgi:hypothetical protein